MKILFLIESLGGGGAEKVLVNLVNRLDRNRYDITVETMFGDGVNREFLAKHIRYISKKAPAFRGMSKVIKLIPSCMMYGYFVGKEKYDLIVAFIQGPPTKVLAGCRDRDTKRVAWLHCSAVSSYISSCWLTKSGALRDYDAFDAVVGVSMRTTAEYADLVGNAEKAHTIYNTNDVGLIKEKALKNNVLMTARRHPLICSIGKLTSPKRIDRLIAVAKNLWDEGYRFDVEILGEGAKRKELENQIETLGAGGYVHLLGFQANPYPYLARADMFVCSSDYEGLSTALTEAIILGLPCVSTDVSGAREVLGDDNEYGIVVDISENGVFGGLKELLDNPSLREHYHVAALEHSKWFSPERTVKQVEDFIDEICSDV